MSETKQPSSKRRKVESKAAKGGQGGRNAPLKLEPDKWPAFGTIKTKSLLLNKCQEALVSLFGAFLDIRSSFAYQRTCRDVYRSIKDYPQTNQPYHLKLRDGTVCQVDIDEWDVVTSDRRRPEMFDTSSPSQGSRRAGGLAQWMQGMSSRITTVDVDCAFLYPFVQDEIKSLKNLTSLRTIDQPSGNVGILPIEHLAVLAPKLVKFELNAPPAPDGPHPIDRALGDCAYERLVDLDLRLHCTQGHVLRDLSTGRYDRVLRGVRRLGIGFDEFSRHQDDDGARERKFGTIRDNVRRFFERYTHYETVRLRIYTSFPRHGWDEERQVQPHVKTLGDDVYEAVALLSPLANTLAELHVDVTGWHDDLTTHNPRIRVGLYCGDGRKWPKLNKLARLRFDFTHSETGFVVHGICNVLEAYGTTLVEFVTPSNTEAVGANIFKYTQTLAPHLERCVFFHRKLKADQIQPKLLGVAVIVDWLDKHPKIKRPDRDIFAHLNLSVEYTDKDMKTLTNLVSRFPEPYDVLYRPSCSDDSKLVPSESQLYVSLYGRERRMDEIQDKGATLLTTLLAHESKLPPSVCIQDESCIMDRSFYETLLNKCGPTPMREWALYIAPEHACKTLLLAALNARCRCVTIFMEVAFGELEMSKAVLDPGVFAQTRPYSQGLDISGWFIAPWTKEQVLEIAIVISKYSEPFEFRCQVPRRVARRVVDFQLKTMPTKRNVQMVADASVDVDHEVLAIRSLQGRAVLPP